MSRSGTGSPQTLAEATSVVLHGEEAARAASFGFVVALLCAIELVFVAFDATPSVRRLSMALALATLGSIGVWVWWRSRDPARYSRGVSRIFAIAAVLGAFVFIHYFGVFSPVTAVVVFGIAFFGQTDDGRWLIPIMSLVVIGYVVSAVVIALGFVRDPGMFVPEPVPLRQRMTMVFMVAAVMITQLVHARLSRNATREALRRATDAVRIALTNEAQLAEARENLDAAIKALAGRGGLFTGTVIGRYRLEEIIGRGAMGEIYAATVEAADFPDSVHDAPPRAQVAVKLIVGARNHEPEIVRRFLKEAEIALRVRGPNLVEVYETGTTPDGTVFIAMELLEGRDLASLLHERSSLPLREVLTLVDDVARGLDTLHAAGVVHRDLKPQNLFLAIGPPTCWKILDYGVSKVVDGDATQTVAQLIGTPGYMSPEQAEGRDVDHRSDVFALGAVTYRALTGRRPFVGRDTPQILYQVVYGMPVRPREVAPHLPRDVELVLGMAIAKDRAARFASAAAFASALRAAASGRLDEPTRAAAEQVARSMPWSHDPIATSRAGMEA